LYEWDKTPIQEKKGLEELSVSLQLGDKNVVWGDVKGQDEPRSFLFSSLAVELTECYKPSLSILFLE